MRGWPEPTAGEIVWCHFPDNINPKPKPRPGLIVSTKEDNDGTIFVSVAYGTSQKIDRLYSGEFNISKSKHPDAYASAGLSYDTKFDLRNIFELPFNDAYFSVPPHAPTAKFQDRNLASEHGPDRCHRFCGSKQIDPAMV